MPQTLSEAEPRAGPGWKRAPGVNWPGPCTRPSPAHPCTTATPPAFREKQTAEQLFPCAWGSHYRQPPAPVLDRRVAQPPLEHLQVGAPGHGGLVNEIVVDHVGGDGGVHAADQPDQGARGWGDGGGGVAGARPCWCGGQPTPRRQRSREKPRLRCSPVGGAVLARTGPAACSASLGAACRPAPVEDALLRRGVWRVDILENVLRRPGACVHVQKAGPSQRAGRSTPAWPCARWLAHPWPAPVAGQPSLPRPLATGLPSGGSA